MPDLTARLQTAHAHYQLVVEALGRIGPVACAETQVLLETLHSDSEATALAAARAVWGIEQDRALIEPQDS